MSREILFSELLLNKKPLKECDLALECNQGNYRLYVVKEPENKCFFAYAVAFARCSGDTESVWDCPVLEVTPLFNVTAYFDGVRHLEFDREDKDMPGYIYYPDMEYIIKLMQKIREIELSICDVAN